MNNFEDEKLWELLGKSPIRKASPAFTQNVLQAIRSEEQLTSSPRSEKKVHSFALLSLSKKWIAVASAACIALVSTIAFLSDSFSSNSIAQSLDANMYDIEALEETALALEDVTSSTSMVEVAYCYTDSLSDDELQYVIAMM